MLACKIGSYYPLCLGIWRPMLPEIKRYLAAGQRSVHGIIEGTASEVILEADLLAAGFDLAMFRDLNTPKDYETELQG